MGMGGKLVLIPGPYDDGPELLAKLQAVVGEDGVELVELDF